MLFNVNVNVRIRLTDEGRAYHRQQHAAIFKGSGIAYRPPEEDAYGWSTWQLWSLMQWFGPGVRLGGPELFHTDIDIVT